jgi:protein TonB
MRTLTVLVSVVLHVALAAAVWRSGTKKRAARPTAVAVVEKIQKKAQVDRAEKAKKAREKKPEPKKAEATRPRRPAPPKLAAVTRPKPEPLPAPVEPVATPAPAAPAETGLELGNDGPGLPVGPATGSGTKSGAPGSGKPGRTPAKPVERVVRPRETGTEERCTEPPTKPLPLKRPNEIEYTQEARASGVEGRLVLRVTINPDGSVAKVEVLHSVNASLDAAAIAAIKTWTFEPAYRCGKPSTGGTYTLARRFELGD